MSRFPVPALAVGWFQVAYADELAPGDVRPLRYFGRDLVAWRSTGGEPHLADAFCPHLGAHLGHGGSVDERGLRCPVHGWRFDGSGACVEVPGLDAVPDRARLRTYPVVERNTLLLAWFHPDGAPPAWEIPRDDEIEDRAFVGIARHDWKIRTIWQEVAENLLDVAHVGELHELEPYTEHEVAEHGVFRRITTEQRLRTHLGLIPYRMRSDHHGPGYAAARFGDHVGMLSSFTPVDDDVVHVRFSFFARDMGSERRTQRIGSFLVQDMVRQTEQHIPIWEHKAYLDDPVYVPADEPIREFRAWAAQFHV